MPGRALVHACKVFPALFTSVSRIRCLLPLPVLVATAWAEGVHSPDFTSLRRSGTALQSRDPRELWASRVVHSLRDGRDTCLSPGLGLGRTVHSVKGQRSAIVHPATSAALLLDQGMPWRRWHVDAGCPHKLWGSAATLFSWLPLPGFGLGMPGPPGAVPVLDEGSTNAVDVVDTDRPHVGGGDLRCGVHHVAGGTGWVRAW
jgi:hypothetical protein